MKDTRTTSQLKKPSGVLVIGAGVIGLTTAHELLTHGHDVTILAREFPVPGDPQTVSQAAGAVWSLPSSQHKALTSVVQKQLKEWAFNTYHKLLPLARATRSTGVRIVENIYLLRDEVQEESGLKETIESFNTLPGFRHSSQLIKEKEMALLPRAVLHCRHHKIPKILE